MPLNGTVTMSAEELSDELETLTAELDKLIENACVAIREGESVTALGHLQTARDILSIASEIEAEEEAEEPEEEDEDEEEDES